MVYVKMAGYLTLFRILTGSLSPTVTSSTASLNKYLIRGIFFPSGDLNYSERDKNITWKNRCYTKDFQFNPIDQP